MTTPEFEAFVLAAYDAIVYNTGKDGTKVRDILTPVTDQVRDAIERGELAAPHIEAAVEKTIRTIDDRRRASAVEDIRYALDALNDDTILGVNDPILRQCRPSGNGLRKALAYFNIEDLDESVSARRRNASAAVAAFESYAGQVDELKRAMRSRGAVIVADLFNPDK